jgi:nucleotide-binding universal stress UspA family protein
MRMPIKDVLLPLVGEPSEQATAAIDKCVAVSGDFGARVVALAIEQDIQVRPQAISPDLDNTEMTEAVRSVTDARGLLRAFDRAAVRFGVRNEQTLQRLPASDIADTLADHARLADLSLLPMKQDGSSEKLAERLLFGSGRPVLICPEERAAELSVAFDDVLIAWDHSAPAARAVADALPLLQSAATVRIITATDSKTPREVSSGSALVAHLAEHGIKAGFETVKIDGSSVGKVFEAHVRSHATDLLVMGAYGHSRLNEIIWGGATKTVIGRPPCWVMISR